MKDQTHEEFECGDIVCAKLEEDFGNGFIDAISIGRIQKIRINDDDTKTIVVVAPFFSDDYDFNYYSPDQLIKLSARQVYQIFTTQKAFSRYTNLTVRR